MSSIRNISNAIRRRIWIARTGVNRFLLHSASRLRAFTGVLQGLAFIAAVTCLVCMVVYVGFEHSLSRRMSLLSVIRVCQVVFALNVVRSMIFDFGHIKYTQGILKWIVYTAVLLTLVPWLIPSSAFSWIQWFCNIIYSRWFTYPVLTIYSMLTISIGIMQAIGKRTNPSLLLSGSFALIIVVGSLLLQLPKCSYAPLSYIDALFVSTSAVCITGLTTVDVFANFTPLGQLILALLIEVGCLGLITFTSFFALFFSGNTSIYSQLMLKDIIYSRSMSSLIPTLRYILGFTVVVEAIGAVFIFLSVHGTTGLPVEDEMWFSVFHSLSSFCNAGFSVLPNGMSNPVLMYGNLSVYWITSVLVIAGGIGFPILVNFKESLFRHLRREWKIMRGKTASPRIIHNYNMNTSIVLVTYGLLFLFGAVVFFIFEYSNTLAGMSWGEKITQSVFNSVTPRSAGFSSVSPSSFLPATLITVMLLMWIGGGSQSTAGGIKVNTFAAICINLRAIVTGRARVTAFSRTIATGSIRRANAVVALSIISYFLFSVALVLLEPDLSTRSLLFEALSALFTVGSSLGVTPYLGPESKILLCVAMFLGRVGIISLLTGITKQSKEGGAHFPSDIIIIS